MSREELDEVHLSAEEAEEKEREGDEAGARQNLNKINANEETLDKDTPFERLAELVKEGGGERRIKAVRLIRQSLERFHDDVLSSGVVLDLVDCVRGDEPDDLQFEAAWALTNIASGTSEETQCVVESGAVPRFVQLIESPSDRVREQVIWALGNIVGDSAQFRDLVLDYGIIVPLAEIVGNFEDSQIVRRQACWVFSNLCRHKQCPLPEDILVEMLPTFCKGLREPQDKVCVKELCWGVSYITDTCTVPRMQIVLNTDLFQLVVQVLKSFNEKDVIHPAVRVVGNVASSNDDHTQKIIDHNALPILHSLLSHDNHSIQKESCWALSNIAAGNMEQKQAVIDEGIIPKFLNILNGEDVHVPLKKEAIWAVCNILDGSYIEQVRYMVNQGVVHSLRGYLNFADNRIICVALDGLIGILKAGACENDEHESNPYVPLIGEFADIIEGLRDHEDRGVCYSARQIMNEYYQNHENIDLMEEDINSNI